MPATAPLRECHEPGRRLLVAEEFAGAVKSLGLPDPEAVRALFAEARPGSGRAPTAVVPLPGHAAKLHLREVRHGGWLGAWLGRAIAGAARPETEIRVTAALHARAAPVPRPILAASWRVAGPIWAGCVGTLHVEDARDGITFLSGEPSAGDCLHFAESAALAIRRFHDAGGRHPDLHLGNLLVQGRGPDAGVLIIDLDRAVAGAPAQPSARIRELMRLQRSAEKRNLQAVLAPRPRARFLSAYTQGERALRGQLCAHLPRELRRLRWHRLGYRLRR